MGWVVPEITLAAEAYAATVGCCESLAFAWARRTLSRSVRIGALSVRKQVRLSSWLLPANLYAVHRKQPTMTRCVKWMTVGLTSLVVLVAATRLAVGAA